MAFNMNPFYFNEILLRYNPDVRDVFTNIEKVWNEFVPGYPLEFNYMNDQIENLYQAEKSLTGALTTFSVIAILISCMGLLALTILSMQNRTKEIGIRKVNGARIPEILSMLNMSFIKWVAVAFIISCPIAWYAMHKWLENFAYKTEISWWIFALAGVIALGIALLTVSFQSWKAAKRNPVEALRYE